MSEISFDEWNYFDNLKKEGVAVCKFCRQRLKNNRSTGLRNHLRKYHSKKSEIWKYFNNFAREGIAECKQCKQRVRNNHSINLIEHMEKSHNINICDMESALKLRKTMSEGDTTSASAIDLTDETSRTNQSTEEMPYVPHEAGAEDLEKYVEPINEENQNILQKRRISRSPDLNTVQHKRAKNFIGVNIEDKIIKSAVWGLMIDEGIEPSLFSSKNMQALIQPICEAISTKKKKKIKIGEAESEKALCLATEHLRKKISNDLDWRLLSLKIDMDPNGPAKTFCVSACFIHEGRIHKQILGVIDLHDDLQLREEHVRKILHKFNIDICQIIFACWDNTKPHYNKFVKNSDYLKEIVNLDSYAEIHLGDIKIERYVGTIANLSLLDIFKNTDIYQQFLKCRNFVKYISNESNGFYDVFKKNNLTMPQLDSPWNWGSTYEMLQHLQEARRVLENEIYPILSEEHFTINTNFWLLIDAFCESLKFIQKSITKYYTEEMHFGDYYAQWLKCKLLTEKLIHKNNSQNKYVNVFSSELLKCIEIRTKEILSNDAFLACLYLDPRFQHTLSLPEKSKAVEFLKKLWSRSKFYNPNVLIHSAESTKNTTESECLHKDEDEFLNEFLCQDAQKTFSEADDFYTKIERLKLPFKSADTNILLFWDSQKPIDPEIFFMSNICFAIPTTQNYNQNLYAHLFKKKNNSKLTAVTRDNLIVVRLNSHVFDDDLQQFGIFCEED